MASTVGTTRLTLSDLALPGPLPVDVTTTTYIQDATTPTAGTVTVALVRVPAGVPLNAGQAAIVFTDAHQALGWTT